MKLDLSKPVINEVGETIKQGDKVLDIMHFVKQTVLTPVESDPKNIEFSRKLQLIFTKLERADQGIVEFKNETITFILERMVQIRMHVLIVKAFEQLVNGEPSEVALDAI